MNKHCISTIPLKQHLLLAKQSGSALIMAIFIIIVISLLGASLVSLQRDSAQQTSYEVYAARAYLAAYSASEISLARLFPLGSREVFIANCISEETAVTLPNDNAGFHGCTVSSRCLSVSSAVATIYKVESTATCKNNQLNVRRKITVEATSL